MLLASLTPDDPIFSEALKVVSRAASSSSPIRDIAVTVLDTLHRSICDFQRDRALEDARYKLGDIRIAGTDSLFSILRDSTCNMEQRMAASTLIGEESSPDDAQELLDMIQHPAGDLTLVIAGALVELVRRHDMQRDIVGQLISLVRRGSEPLTKEAALYALGMIGDAQAMECAREVYANAGASLEVRLQALRTAGQLGDDNTPFRGLSDPSPDVRVAAIGLIDPFAPGVHEVLLKLLLDDAKTVTTLDGETVADAVRWKLDIPKDYRNSSKG